MCTIHQLFRSLITYIKNGTLIATLCTKSCIILIIALIFSLDLCILHWNHKPAQYKYVHTYQGCLLIFLCLQWHENYKPLCRRSLVSFTNIVTSCVRVTRNCRRFLWRPLYCGVVGWDQVIYMIDTSMPVGAALDDAWKGVYLYKSLLNVLVRW